MWLVIGGSGFIGANFANFLTKQGIDFWIYDIKKSKYHPRNTRSILGDIRDEKKISNSMKDCDVVFHLATVPPGLKISENEIYDIDVNGTKNVLNAAVKNGVKRVIFTSSASHVYGAVKKEDCPIREDHKLRPINEYGRNKVLAERLCNEISQETNLETIILRLSMVVGPYNCDPILLENAKSILQNKKVIILGKGDGKGQSMHVQDVNTALLASVEKLKMTNKNEIFNISGEETYTINEWINLFKQVSDSKSKNMHVPLSFAKIMASIAWKLNKTMVHPSYLDLMAQDQYFDISKAKKMLKWKPENSMEDALRSTIKYLKKEQII